MGLFDDGVHRDSLKGRLRRTWAAGNQLLGGLSTAGVGQGLLGTEGRWSGESLRARQAGSAPHQEGGFLV